MMAKSRGFTLVEVLVSVLIIGLVAIASFTSFFVLSEANERSRNRLWAISLSQAALEEVKAQAKSNFDNLETISFSDIDQTQYSGFHRTITITVLSSLFKRADVTISWKERGQSRQYNTSLLISEPPEPLPANIHGKVTNANTGVAVEGARTTITHESGSPTLNRDTDTNGYYSFVDTAGNFQLKTGTWFLQVSRNGYYDYGPILVEDLASGEDREVNIQLTPKPDPAYIKGRFVNVSGSLISLTDKVRLYEKGTKIDEQSNSPSGFSFTINFTDINPRCFTIFSLNAYKNRYCGNFCGPSGPMINPSTKEKPYNYHGWSSSVVRADGSIVCDNPWVGNSTADRLCVNPGELLNLGDIPLVSVPTAVLQGYVYAPDGVTLVAGATVTVRWHDGTSWWPSTTTTNSSGFYTISVPAEQDLFPDSTSYYLEARASGYVPITACCGQPKSEYTATSYEDVGPLYSGTTFSKNFTLPAKPNYTCGTAHGWVKNGSDLISIPSASVSIGSTVYTDAAGDYKFVCSNSNPYPIKTGSYDVRVQKSGYYDFYSAGSFGSWNYYTPQGYLPITVNDDKEYNFDLWPRGYGTITVSVVREGTNNAIVGANVELDYYSDGSVNRNEETDEDGDYTFNSVPETWPAPAVVGNSYYTQDMRRHSLKVSASGYYDYTESNIILNAGDIQVKNIELKREGGW